MWMKKEIRMFPGKKRKFCRIFDSDWAPETLPVPFYVHVDA